MLTHQLNSQIRPIPGRPAGAIARPAAPAEGISHPGHGGEIRPGGPHPMPGRPPLGGKPGIPGDIRPGGPFPIGKPGCDGKPCCPMPKDGFDFQGVRPTEGDVKQGGMVVEGMLEKAAGQSGKGMVKASDLEAFKQEVAQNGPPMPSEGNSWAQKVGEKAASLWQQLSGGNSQD